MSDEKTPGPDLTRDGLRSALFRGLTGLRPAPKGHPTAAVEDMLRTIAGVTRRGVTTVDTAKAARLLGVSRRTVERYRTTSGQQRYQPAPAVMKKLQQRSRQAATTRRGRAAALAPARGTRADGTTPAEPRGTDAVQQRGGRLRIRGKQGVMRGGSFYPRERQIFLPVTAGDVDALRGSYVSGGDDAAMQWMRDHADAVYTSGWDFDRIDDMGFSSDE